MTYECCRRDNRSSAETTEIADHIADRVEAILKKHGRSLDLDEADFEPTEVQLNQRQCAHLKTCWCVFALRASRDQSASPSAQPTTIACAMGQLIRD
jgi:hypothetical protein